MTAPPDPVILVADDHPLVRSAVRSAVRHGHPGAELLECATLDEVLAALEARQGRVDLALLDLNMPGSQGLLGLFVLLGSHPTVPAAIISAVSDPATIRHALACGAAGYIPKSLPMEEIGAAVDLILEGGIFVPPGVEPEPPREAEVDLARRIASLSPQQTRVLAMMAEGKLNKQISFALGLAEQTVKQHVTQIFRKLGVASRTQAVILLNQLNIRLDGQEG
ncbi:MAG TPA: response regulator transcription factor [Azospirillaceae bacterium]|nr:response regulator transcription factor [Azospirillaceae bacterium]